MRIKKIMFMLALLFISQSAFPMQADNDVALSSMSPELVERIFYFFDRKDVPNLCLVCGTWGAIMKKEALWANFFEREFGSRAKKFKSDSETWNAFFKSRFLFVKNILGMKEWREEDLDNFLQENEKDEFKRVKQLLLENLEGAVSHCFGSNNIENTIQLSAFYMAYYKMYFSYGCIIPYNASREITPGGAPHYFDGQWRDATSAAQTAAYALLALIGAERDFLDKFDDKPFKVAKAACLDSVCMLVQNKIGKRPVYCLSANLCQFYIMAYIAQHVFIHSHFYEYYQGAAANLEGLPNPTLSKREILEIIAKDTWEKEEFSCNPYFVVMRNLLESFCE